MNKKNLILEKLPISNKLQTEVYKQIGTEEFIRWAGQPISIAFIEEYIIRYILGGIWIISGGLFFVFCALLLILESSFLIIQNIILLIIFLLMIPLLFYLGFWVLSMAIKSWKKREIERVYLITNQRAIKISCGIKSCSVTSYPPSQLIDISLRER